MKIAITPVNCERSDHGRHGLICTEILRSIPPPILWSRDKSIPPSRLRTTLYTATHVEFMLNQKIYREKFLVRVGGSYERDDYIQGWIVSTISGKDSSAQGTLREVAGFGCLLSLSAQPVDRRHIFVRANVVSVDGLLHF